MKLIDFVGDVFLQSGPFLRGPIVANVRKIGVSILIRCFRQMEKYINVTYVGEIHTKKSYCPARF